MWDIIINLLVGAAAGALVALTLNEVYKTHIQPLFKEYPSINTLDSMKVETLVELVYDASKNASPEKADMYEKILGGFQVGTDTSSLVTMGHDQASNTYQCRLAKGDTNNNDFQRCVQRFYRNGQHQKIALRY